MSTNNSTILPSNVDNVGFSTVFGINTPSINGSGLNDDGGGDYSFYAFPLPSAIVLSFILFSLCAVTIFGNLLVILSFITDVNIRKRYDNWFILMLSVADLIVGAISLPLNSLWVLSDHWPFGKSVCQFFLVADYIACFMSVISMVFISLDRYWLVTKELKYFKFQSLTRVLIMIISSWTMVITFYLLTVFKWTIWIGENWVDYTQECELEALGSVAFNSILFVIEFVIPFTAIVVFNVIIYINIRKRSQGLVSKNQVAFVSEKSKKSNNTQMLNKHRRAAKNLSILVSAFLICRLPLYIISITSVTCDDCVSNTVWELVNYVLWCNSTINPLLYAITKPIFKNNFKKIVCRCKRFKTDVTNLQISNNS
ncbi:histamine H4 receptor-like [Antedon mediterranea]|uniref:histamine H4 receptor-like n=1 Tax=Antedon mediterranea TaxID=105859 RepID=UPI003AF5BF71